MTEKRPVGRPPSANPRSQIKGDQVVWMTIGEAAAMCGVSYATFGRWRQSGKMRPPDVDATTGKISSILLGEFIREKIHAEYAEVAGYGEKLNATHEKARKEHEMANKLEMENAVRAGRLIEAGHVTAALQDMVMRSRARLLRLPATLARLLVGQTDMVQIQNQIETGIRDALTELSVEWRSDDE